MASDTVPAAVPGAGDPPSTPPATAPAEAPAAGGMAGLLAPVAPVRFSLDPTDGAGGHHTADGTAGVGEQAISGASSADFHNADTTPGNGTQNNASRTEQTGVIRAWLLAGAERWRKGADARNKALDIKKARAQAYKEAVTTTVNRSEKMVGGSTSTNSGTNTQAKSDKNTGSKNSSHNSGSGGRGSGAGSGGGRGPAGNSGGTSRNDSSRNGNGKGSGAGGDRHSNGPGRSNSGGGSGNTHNGAGRGDKQARKDSSSGGRGPSGTDRSSSTHNGSGSRGPAGANRESSRHGSDTHSTSNSPRSGKDRGGRGTGSDVTTQTCGDASGIDKKPGKQDRRDDTKAGAKPETYKVVLDKDPKPAPTDGKTTPKDAPTPAPGAAKNKDGKGGTARPAAGAPTAPRRINTQGAREAGYRDGTRVGQVIAQTGAYRDGARDGLADTREAAQQEKTRLDQARQDRRNGTTQPRPERQPPAPQQSQPGPVIPPRPTVPPRPTEPPAPTPRDLKPPTPPATPAPAPAPRTERPAPAADTKNRKDEPVPPTNAQPVQVNRVGKTSIELGAGASRSIISHGEVRTLRAFQHRLKTKADGMTRVVEACAGLESYAEQQLAKAIWWTEQARTVKGGDHLIAALMKLEEAATVQVRKAAEIRKRAARAADSCRALISNVEIRYEPIYKAVCDSPLTKPAVVAYYRKMANA